MNAELRSEALHLAIAASNGSGAAAQIVKTADTFLSFLSGGLDAPSLPEGTPADVSQMTATEVIAAEAGAGRKGLGSE